MDGKIESVVSNLNGKIKGVATDLSSKINRIADDLRAVLFERTMASARRSEAAIPPNALAEYITAVEIALESPFLMELELTDALDGIIRLLEGGLHPETYYLGRLKPVLDRLPAKHADAARKIRALAGIPA